MPKLVWLDTGLVNYAAQVQKEVLGAKDIMDAWRGMIAEQIVAQELLTLTDKVSQKRCFWCVIKVVLMQKSIMCGCRILWFIPLKSNQGITPTYVPYILL